MEGQQQQHCPTGGVVRMHPPGGRAPGTVHTVVLVQSFSTSWPLASTATLKGAQPEVTLLLHTVALLLLSTILRVPLGLSCRLHGPGEVALVLNVTLPVLSVTVSVPLLFSVAAGGPLALAGAARPSVLGPEGLFVMTVTVVLVEPTTGPATARRAQQSQGRLVSRQEGRLSSGEARQGQRWCTRWEAQGAAGCTM